MQGKDMAPLCIYRYPDYSKTESFVQLSAHFSMLVFYQLLELIVYVKIK